MRTIQHGRQILRKRFWEFYDIPREVVLFDKNVQKMVCSILHSWKRPETDTDTSSCFNYFTPTGQI